MGTDSRHTEPLGDYIVCYAGDEQDASGWLSVRLSRKP